MTCHGGPSWRLGPPLVAAELHYRHEPSGRSILDAGRHQQLRSVLSSVEAPGPATQNDLRNLVLPVPNSLLCYGPALAFRSRIIVDLLPAQDSRMGFDQRIYSFSSSSSSGSRTNIPPPHSNSVFSNSGQTLWRPTGELARVKRNGGKAGAGWVSISSEASQENSERRRKTEGEFSGGGFDSNAENVRRRRPPSDFISSFQSDTSPRFSSEGRSGRAQAREEREWDYESPDADDQPRPAADWQRWWSNVVDASDDEDEEEEDDEDQGLFSFLNSDLPAALTVLRWGLPALLLLGFAGIPKILGNPLILLLLFSLFPSLAQALNPLGKQFVRAVTGPFRESSARRKRRRFKSRSPVSRSRDQEQVRYNSNGSGAQIAGRAPESDSPRQGSTLGPSGFGGWDDLAEDRNGFQSLSRRSSQKIKKPSKKKLRREQPVFVRIIFALFPFLRGWGGIL